ncbi:hypothetical protein WISP_104914 [Willisornis vidua]|uniref:Uncharacterized protein n=1 Tax=Willisornis vidua TaxID=1566151 RepID=A0ABQ9D2U4_9PASS|nr:hypothetical protein WISP_104914 [Willisornis vidua]
MTVHEVESKASRETIIRLVSEVVKERKKLAGYCQVMEILSKELFFMSQEKVAVYIPEFLMKNIARVCSWKSVNIVHTFTMIVLDIKFSFDEN